MDELNTQLKHSVSAIFAAGYRHALDDVEACLRGADMHPLAEALLPVLREKISTYEVPVSWETPGQQTAH